MPTNLYTFDQPSRTWRSPGKSPISINETVDNLHDWSEQNVPWAYASTSEFTEHWPSNTTIVDIQTGSNDFYTNLSNTVNANSGRIVVRLGEGVYHLNQFRMIGNSGDPTYAFGFWFPSLQGFLGQGPDKTFVQMDANSMSQAQLDTLRGMSRAGFSPNQMGLCRFDGTDPTKPVLLAGLTFRAADQNLISGFTQSDMQDLYTPQPAPHQGVMIYAGAYATLSHVRFQAAARALTSAPPFEHGNLGSSRGTIRYYFCEFDGRRSPDLDPAQPRRCGPVMVNNEELSEFNDCWFHHSNVSRYAANDQNSDSQGQYILNRCKLEQITNTQNRDPALNNGNSLGGYTNASALGWESTNGTITLTDCIVSQDNTQSSGQVPMHLQLTSVGSRNPQGGRLYVHGGSYRNTGWPQLDGFVCFRISSTTYWWTDGFDTTLFVYHPNGQRLTAYNYTGTWPVSASTLSAAGITPTTHYIIRKA